MSEVKENNPKRPAKEIDKNVYLASLDSVDKKNILDVVETFKEFCVSSNKVHSIIFAVGGSVIDETRGSKRPDIDLMIVSDKEATFEGFTKGFKDLILKKIERSSIEKITEPYFDNQGLGVLEHTGSVKLKFSNSTSSLEFFSNPTKNCHEQIEFDRGSVTQGGKKPRDFCILYEYFPK